MAAIAWCLTFYKVDFGIPPQAVERPVDTGAAVVQLLLDTDAHAFVTSDAPLDGLTSRAAVLPDFVSSPLVVDRIAALMHIKPSQVATRGTPPAGFGRGRQVGEDQRATELSSEGAPYRIFTTASRDAPVISIYTRGPSPELALKLAQAASTALGTYLDDLQTNDGVPPRRRVRVVQLGDVQTGWVNRGAGYLVAALAAIGALFAWVLVLMLFSRARVAVATDRAKSLLFRATGSGSAGGRRRQETPDRVAP